MQDPIACADHSSRFVYELFSELPCLLKNNGTLCFPIFFVSAYALLVVSRSPSLRFFAPCFLVVIFRAEGREGFAQMSSSREVHPPLTLRASAFRWKRCESLKSTYSRPLKASHALELPLPLPYSSWLISLAQCSRTWRRWTLRVEKMLSWPRRAGDASS